MPIPPTDDYTYTYDKAGTGLNLLELNPVSETLPFWDVYKLAGLDLPDFNPIMDEIQGQHGGVVRVAWSGIRTIIAEGELYADPDDIDTEVDRVKAIMLPELQNFNRKWWLKQPGAAAKYLWVKPVAFKYDIETGRRIGKMQYQLQWAAEDPRMYIDATSLNLVDNVAQNAINNGPVPSFPTITITGTNLTDATVTNVTTGKALTISRADIGVDTWTLNFLLRRFLVNGSEASANVTGSWWRLDPGTSSVKVDIGSGTGVTITFAYASAWL